MGKEQNEEENNVTTHERTPEDHKLSLTHQKPVYKNMHTFDSQMEGPGSFWTELSTDNETESGTGDLSGEIGSVWRTPSTK